MGEHIQYDFLYDNQFAELKRIRNDSKSFR